MFDDDYRHVEGRPTGCGDHAALLCRGRRKYVRATCRMFASVHSWQLALRRLHKASLNSWNAAPPRASGFGQRRQGISLSNAYQEAAAKQRPKHSPSARGRRALNFESYIFSIMLLGGKAGCQDSFEVFLAAGVRPQPKAFGTGTWCFDVGHSAEIIRAGISREAA